MDRVWCSFGITSNRLHHTVWAYGVINMEKHMVIGDEKTKDGWLRKS